MVPFDPALPLVVTAAAIAPMLPLLLLLPLDELIGKLLKTLTGL